ncbi:allene oxide synthase-lipoxygenase protein-like isoform X3 [Mytilus galloprovincialis]|uniref:allene oxide synthase-lipoxygenase protein-like isoform X3 n=1 Tax=Mytilus galloprovincialis TaxID=29158 RepID=UPI003F7C6554
MGRISYIVLVKTGDKKLSGTDANVSIILYGCKGIKTEEFVLDKFFRNDFESGTIDSFPVESNINIPQIERIELWRDTSGISSSWYVDWIEVKNQTTAEASIFPVFRWIKGNYHYCIQHLDTSLSQCDKYPNQRYMELSEKRKTYQLKVKFENGPAQVKEIPSDEQFSFDYKWNIAKRKIQMIATSKLHMLLNGANWESLFDLTNVYSDAFGEPEGVKKWSNDIYFGSQRISSMNHSLIELCTAMPHKMNITEDELKPFLEGWSIQQVIKANRLFIIDLKDIKDIPVRSPELILTCPIALFFLNGKKQLVPIAIQLFQEKREDNPVFIPTDPPHTWLMAKMWYNLADASYHQSLTHLAFTHLLMEGVCVVTHRQLSQSHPIFKLLAPHFLYLIAINTRGLDLLVAPNGWVDKTMAIGIKGMFSLIARGINIWRMDTHGTLPEDLKRRGLLNTNILPGYHFRDDALLLYQAIKNYVSKYVKLYYDKPEKIFDDWEIMTWGNELTKSREKGGCGILGVPNNGKFATVEDLTITLTSIIYTCSVGHASTNFPQYDEYAFPPNYPACLKGTPPKDKSPLTENDILIALPDKPTTLDIMTVTKILSDRGTNSIGDFEVQYIFDPPAKNIVNEFREELKDISKTIKERNKKREPPYIWLDPDFVPNSISI